MDGPMDNGRPHGQWTAPWTMDTVDEVDTVDIVDGPGQNGRKFSATNVVRK